MDALEPRQAALIILATTRSEGSGMSDLRQGLIGEYLFDGGAEDTSGNGRHTYAV